MAERGLLRCGRGEQSEADEGAVVRPVVPATLPAAVVALLSRDVRDPVLDRRHEAVPIVDGQSVEEIGHHVDVWPGAPGLLNPFNLAFLLGCSTRGGEDP